MYHFVAFSDGPNFLFRGPNRDRKYFGPPIRSYPATACQSPFSHDSVDGSTRAASQTACFTVLDAHEHGLGIVDLPCVSGVVLGAAGPPSCCGPSLILCLDSGRLPGAFPQEHHVAMGHGAVRQYGAVLGMEAYQ